MELYFTGASGQVGRALKALCPEAVGWTRGDVDLAAGVDLSSLLPTPPRPGSVLINLAAFTAVDAAEDPERCSAARRVNGAAVGELAEQARALGMPMIQVSTDYVFSGRRETGACNREDAPTGPINEYGRGKLEGERAALAAGAHVVRTSWVYTGPHNEDGDFVKTMDRLARQGVDPNVVDDQWGRPTYALDLAAGLLQVARRLAAEEDVPRILHCTNSGEAITWCELAKEVFRAGGHDASRVHGIPTADYPTPAPRPLNATLCIDGWAAAGLQPLPAWRESVAKAME